MEIRKGIGRRGAGRWGIAGALVLMAAGAAMGQQAVTIPGPATESSSSTPPTPAISGAVVVPTNARAGMRGLRPIGEQAGSSRAAGAAAPAADRWGTLGTGVVQYESLMRGDDKRFSVTTLRNPAAERQGWPLWRAGRQRGGGSAAPAPAESSPGIGDPGFDPFNTFHRNAVLQFDRAANTPIFTPADQTHRDAELRFDRAANTPITTPADQTHRDAELRFNRAAMPDFAGTRR